MARRTDEPSADSKRAENMRTTLLLCTVASVIWYLITLQRIAQQRKDRAGRPGAGDDLGSNWFAFLDRTIYTEEGQRLYPQFVLSAVLSMAFVLITVFSLF